MTDFDGITAAVEILRGLDLFSQVVGGFETTGPDEQPTELPWVWVRPSSWATTSAAGGFGGEDRIRTVKFEAEVRTQRGGDPDLQRSPGDLALAVEQALHGRSLAGSYPALTRCESGRYDRIGKSTNAEHVLLVTGEFAYPI